MQMLKRGASPALTRGLRLFALGAMCGVVQDCSQPSDGLSGGDAIGAHSSSWADTLDIRAMKLYGSSNQWRTAAKLHARAAQLRGDDIRAVASWRQAAWLYAALGDNGQAREMMRRAAEHATEIGDIEAALGAYVDAAHLAMIANQPERAGELLRRARTLLNSPLLTSSQRQTVLRRVTEIPRLERAWQSP
jgi:hypothetical protein